MPAYKCLCDHWIDASKIPNPNEWLMISDIQYDECVGKIDAEELFKRFTHMLKCPNCSRLWVFWDGFKSNPICYEVVVTPTRETD